MTKIGNKNNLEKCRRYKMEGRREINKAKKAERRAKRVARRIARKGRLLK